VFQNAARQCAEVIEHDCGARADRHGAALTPPSPEVRDALKAIVAVHFDCPNAVTVAPEMYNGRWRKK
jgi:hypothetical protein